jgi:hypothetical protein
LEPRRQNGICIGLRLWSLTAYELNMLFTIFLLDVHSEPQDIRHTHSVLKLDFFEPPEE